MNPTGKRSPFAALPAGVLLLAALPAAAAPQATARAAAKPAGKAAAKPAGKAAAKPAPSPVVSLTVAPADAVLDGPKARQQLLVTGLCKNGSQVDLTGKAKFSTKTPKIVTVSPDGVAHPTGDGAGAVTVTASGKETTFKLTAKNVAKPFVWNFENHVVSVLSKEGCNMGACHGAAAGKNGFRLTLRGYDPDLDYDRLLHEAGGRRIERADPGNSLLLKKATMAVPHAGGLRFQPGSLEYKVIADWIASGMPGPAANDPKMVGLEVYPTERTLTENAQQQLLVRAKFSDGHVEDVTNWARYSSNEEAIATVGEDGKVETKGVGETAITVWYLGKVSFARVTVPFANNVKPSDYKTLTASNSSIDQAIAGKLQKLKIVPSDVATDEEFCRRVYLDCIGTLPSATEVRTFLSSPAPDKRSKLIDELLERPEYVDFWTYKWGDLFRVNRDTLTEKGMWAMYSWLRDSIAENKPWDKLVYECLTANGDNFVDGPSNFYRISRTPEDLTETVSQAFLGIRVQCARCHNHPFEKWTQKDYYKFANLLSRINRKQGDNPQDLVITAAASGGIAFPKTGKELEPTPYDGTPMDPKSTDDRRIYLATWLTSAKNEYFVRAIVNRVWRHYMGRGLIEPVDDLRATNPASNEALMSTLSNELVSHNFDLKFLMREIMNSRAYQLTSRPRPENKKDDRQYSRYFVKRLTAEQLLDAICQVTNQPEKFPGLPQGYRAIQLPDTRVANYFLDVFGRPPRQITCDCERAQEPNMAQALHLINGAGVNQKISADSGLVATLIKSGKKDTEIIQELYLTCFGRVPSGDEEKAALSMIDEAMHPAPAPPAPAAKPADPNAKPADPKAADAKPADPKAAAKPADPKATVAVKADPKVAVAVKADPKAAPATKAVDPKKADPKIAAAKPAVDPKAAKVDPKAAAVKVDPKAKPADPKTAEAKPADPKATAAAKPADAKPMDAKPAEQPKIDPVVARRQVLEDLLWALINGKEFVFNH